jgi:diguanylate cyclase (GGDEF)-like protein
MQQTLLYLLLVLPGWALAENPTRNLSGSWKFQAGDDIAWAATDHNDSQWQVIWVPETWHANDADDFAWYRRTVDISAYDLEDLGLQIGAVRSAHEVYVNGQLMGRVGKLPPEPEVNYDLIQVYRIPSSLVNSSDRVTLALRIWGGSEKAMMAAGAGPYGGPFLIGSYRQLLRGLDAEQVPKLIFASLFLLAGVSFLYLHAKTRAVAAFFWFGATSVMLALYIVTQTQWKHGLNLSFLTLEKIEAMSFFIFLALTAELIWNVIEKPTPLLIRLVQALYAALSVVYLFAPDLAVHYTVRPFWQMLIVLSMFPVLWVVVRQTQQGNQDARLLLYGFVVFVLCGTNDLLINLNVYTDNGTRLLPIGFLAILVAMGTCLAGKFNLMLTSLEYQVALRTEELSQVNEELEKANNSLVEMTRIDPLTGLLNRRGLSAEAEIERQRFIRQREPLALMMADIDHFKRVNDKYGHACGDKVLSEIATLFRDHIRDIDRVARWGGEEFVLLFPGTDRDGLANIADKLKQRIEHFEIEYEGRLLKIIMTFGGAIYQASETIYECLARADAALYEGKTGGRNQVVLAQ